MKTIDTRGELCPIPIIMTKKALSTAMSAESIEVLTDNDTSKCNLLSYLTELGYVVSCDVVGDYFKLSFIVGSTIEIKDMPEAEMFCDTIKSRVKLGNFVVALRGEFMGTGDDNLGAILMRACVNSLAELDALPSAIVMYNSGVKLALKGRDTAQTLVNLQERGVKIIVCGTCVDYYEIKSELAVGKISNMYTINLLLAEAGHVVYP